MNKSKILQIFALIVFSMLILIVAFFAGGILLRQQPQTKEEKQITSQTVIEKITSEAFVVTKTVYLNQKATLKIDKGSEWSNFWWGQEINTEALIKLNVGVDFNELSLEDVEIDETTKTIRIKLPAAEILNASAASDIEVNTTNGILRMLFANNPNQDFNLALDELINQSKQAVGNDEEILLEAREDSIKVLKLVLSEIGYQIEISN